MKCLRFQGLLIRNLRHQPQKQKAGEPASFTACGPATKVPICAGGEVDSSLSVLTSPHSPLGSALPPFPEAAEMGVEGNTTGLPCQSLSVGFETLWALRYEST